MFSLVAQQTYIIMADISESKRLSTPEEYAQLVDKFDTFLFDCDGVVWSGPTLIPGVREVISWLRSKGEPDTSLVVPPFAY